VQLVSRAMPDQEMKKPALIKETARIANTNARLETQADFSACYFAFIMVV
jgi:hypothetical protein